MDERAYNPFEIKKFKKCQKCGIYQIRNKVDNKIYIGSSKELKIRKSKHFRMLKDGKHDNKHLQRAFNKYGESNFVFEIVELCDENEQFVLEQYWIDKFFGKNCYNINSSAVKPPDCTGKKRTFTEAHRKNLSAGLRKSFQENPERRKEMSEARIGKNRGHNHVHSISVICLETRKEFGGIQEASRETGCSSENIRRNCLNIYKASHGLHWVFKKDYEKMTKEDVQEKLVHTRGKTVVCLETRKVYGRVIDAMADTGVIRDNIIDCCNGKMKEAKGLHWVYYDEYKKMSEIDIENKLKEHTATSRKCMCIETQEIFHSLAEASRALKLSESKICSVCSGKRKTTGGLHFKYL